jgi:hypothetical protein
MGLVEVVSRATAFGMEQHLDLKMVFMGMWDPGDALWELNDHRLIDADERNRLEDCLMTGADPEVLLRDRVRRAYYEYCAQTPRETFRVSTPEFGSSSRSAGRRAALGSGAYLLMTRIFADPRARLEPAKAKGLWSIDRRFQQTQVFSAFVMVTFSTAGQGLTRPHTILHLGAVVVD